MNCNCGYPLLVNNRHKNRGTQLMRYLISQTDVGWVSRMGSGHWSWPHTGPTKSDITIHLVINPYSADFSYICGLGNLKIFKWIFFSFLLFFFCKWELSVRHTSIDVLHLVLPSVLYKKSQDRITAQCWKHGFLWPTILAFENFLTLQMFHEYHDVYGTSWCWKG